MEIDDEILHYYIDAEGYWSEGFAWTYLMLRQHDLECQMRRAMLWWWAAIGAGVEDEDDADQETGTVNEQLAWALSRPRKFGWLEDEADEALTRLLG